MRKIVLFAIVFTSFLQGVFAYNIIYQNSSNGGHLYTKVDSDISNGSQITSVNSFGPSLSPNGNFVTYTSLASYPFLLYIKTSTGSDNGTQITSAFAYGNKWSPDGNFIYYANGGDSFHLYKKTSTGSDDGSSISPVGADNVLGTVSFAVSGDGTNIYYVNHNDGNKLYLKSSSSYSTGTAIGTDALGELTISPDGNWIVYVNHTHSDNLYIKSAFDTSNGTGITNIISYSPTYTPDGNSIIYSNGSDSNKLYIKTSTGSDNGTAINSANSFGAITLYPPYTPPGTCTDGIQNQDETGIDTGGVCGNQTCSTREVNYKYRTGGYGTGAYLSGTISEISGSGAQYNADTYYLVDFTKVGGDTTFDKMEFSLHGAIVSEYESGSYRNFRDLIDRHSMVIDTPGKLQSPVHWSDGDKPFSSIQIGTVYPIEWIALAGTGSGYTGSLNPDKIGDSYRNIAGVGCVFLADKDDKFIQDKPGSIYSEKVGDNSCFYLGTYSHPSYVPVTGLVNGDTVSLYKIQMVFTDTYADGRYWVTMFNAGRYGDGFTTQYICVNNDNGSITSPEGPISQDTFQEITGSGDIARQSVVNSSLTGALNGTINFSFGTIPSVSSGADCSNIFNTSSGQFLYGSANSTLNWNMQSNFQISAIPWSCKILTSDICNTAYDGVNYIANWFFSIFMNGVNVAGLQLKNSVSYMGTPVPGQYYCFAGKNMLFTGRPSSYTDTKGNTHTLSTDTLTLLDLLVDAILFAGAVYILIFKK